MMAWLRGRVVMRDGDTLVVDVGGVGWRVICPRAVLETARPNAETEMFLESVSQRDELPRLFGFADLDERDWFRALVKVQGVGPMAAMAILSSAGTGARLGEAIRVGREDVVRAASGVGAKLARRVMAELSARAEEAASGALDDAAPPSHTRAAMAALRALGFTEAEAARGLREGLTDLAETEDAAATPVMVRAALRRLGGARGVGGARG